MALRIPTTEEIIARNIANFEAQFNQTVPLVDKAFLRVVAIVMGMTETELNRYALELSKQNLALTAKGADLEQLGSEYGVTIKAAESTQLEVDTDGSPTTEVPGGQVYVGDSNNVRYANDETVETPGGGTATLEITALEAGVAGNLANGETLTISTPVSGMETEAVVTDTLTTGLDRETDDSYRRRILNEIRTVGGGGNSADYRTWAEATAGVERAFPYAGAPLRPVPEFLDGDCELAGVAEWTVGNAATLTKNGAAPQAGTQNLRIAFNAVNNPYAEQVPLVIGRQYTFTGYAKGDATYKPSIQNGAGLIYWTGTAVAVWQPFSITFFANSTALWLYSDCIAAGFVEFDSMVLNNDSMPGERLVFIESTTDVDPDGIPPSVLLGTARDNINTDPLTGKSRPPLGETDETLYVEPITRTEVFIQIDTLVVDAALEADTKTKIAANLDTYLRSIIPFVEGLDLTSEKNNVITKVVLSEIVQDVLNTVGASAEAVNFGLDGAVYTTTTYTLGQGEMSKSGGVVYI